MRGSIEYSVHKLDYRLRFSRRQTMAISVYPDSSIEIVAPLGTNRNDAEARLRKRARWVIRQLLHFQQLKPRSPKRRYVGGETHLYLGRQYRIKLAQSECERVSLKGGYFRISSPKRNDPRRVKKLLAAWYREKSVARIMERFDFVAARFSHLGGPTPTPIFRSMVRRWGSFSRSGRISLNPDLIRAPISCIDYVITHELIHLIYPNHSAAFFDLLDALMPDWQFRKQRLETIML